MTPIRLLHAAVRTRLPALLLALCLATPAAAQVTLNLKDADIGTLIATVSEVTGRNFIVDPRVKGKVTVVSATPMDPDSVYETFLAVLQVQGFAAVPNGDTIKIVPETGARTEGSSFAGGASRLANDEIVTQVYAIQNVSAVQLVPILRPLVPQWGHLAAYPASNMLIISDRAANVMRLEALIRQIDQSSDREIDMVQLQHASASEVVRTVTTLSQTDKSGEGATMPAVVIADERSNSVLIGGDKSERQKLLDIIMRLDIPVGEDGATQVVYLNYADAENLAPILEGYAQQIGEGEARATATAAAPTGGAVGSARVVADKDTNALIVTAPPKAMRQIRDVISQLDIRRSQVLVEGIVAELSQNRSSQLGVDWAVFNGDRIAAASILDPATLSALATVAAADSGDVATSAASALSQGVNIAGGVDGGSNGTSFALLLKALRGDGDSNVLSTPSITTMDNEEAKFSVGQEVPFLTGSFSNTGSTNGSVNPFQTINREDVGLTLGITPQINEGNNVKLKLELEISSLASGATGAVDLVTNKRTLSNTVAVENGQILVLGGLLDDSLNESQRRVPFVSAIPVLGELFKYRSIERVKRNLMIFIRPSILRDQASGNYYTRRKYEALRNEQIEGNRSIPLLGGQRPVMRSYEDYQSDQLTTPPAPADGPPSAAEPEPEPVMPTLPPPTPLPAPVP